MSTETFIGNDVGLPLFLSIVLVRVLQKALSLPLSICVCSCLLIKEQDIFLYAREQRNLKQQRTKEAKHIVSRLLNMQ